MKNRKEDDELASEDDRLIHGLLRVAKEDPGRKEERISRAMDAIQRQVRPATPSRSRLVLSVAASLLFALVLVGVFSGGESAKAVVRSTIDTIEAGTSRRYTLDILVRGEAEPALSGTVDLERLEMDGRLSREESR